MTTNDSAYFDREDDENGATTRTTWSKASLQRQRHLNETDASVDALPTRATNAKGANFPAARTILWDDDDAVESFVRNASDGSFDGDDGNLLRRCEAFANAPVISMSGRTTEEIARIISEMNDEDEAVDGVRARSGWSVRPRVVCLVGDNSDASSTVTVTAKATSRLRRSGGGAADVGDDDDEDIVLGDRQVEISAVLVPYDAVGNEYSVSSTLHGTAWDDEEALRRAFHFGCESDAPLCPATFYPMRAAATLVDDESSPGDLALRIVFAVDAPACTFELRRINPLRLALNQISRNMLDVDASVNTTNQRSGIATGFVTLDRARRVILLDESATGTREEPVTGVWVRGVDDVDVAAVWAACLRFACSERLNKLTQRGRFLLVAYVAGASVPQFFEVIASQASSPFVPYGIDAVVRPGESILVKSSPLDEGVVPNYFTVKPEEYEERYYRDASTDEDAEDYETDDEEGYVDEALYDEAYEIDRRERAAQMEMLQKEIDSLRDAIARASEEEAGRDEEEGEEDDDDKEYDELGEAEYEVRRIKESDDEEDNVSVSDQVHLLAEDLNKKIMQSRGVAEDESTFRVGFDPAAAGYVRVPENEAEAEALADALRDIDEDILRLRRPNELALDRESELRAQLRAEYGDVPQMVTADADAKNASDKYFPKIKFNPDALIDEEEKEEDDDIIKRYVDKYGEDGLLAAL